MKVIDPKDEFTFRIRQKVNAYREWEWDGPEPLNKRMNRFIATVEASELQETGRSTHGIYTVEYNGLKPFEIIHKIEHRHAYSASAILQNAEYNHFAKVAKYAS